MQDITRSIRKRTEYQQAGFNYYAQAAKIAPSPITKILAQLNQLSLLLESEKWSEARELALLLQPQLNSLPLSRTEIYSQINFGQSLMKLGTADSQKAKGKRQKAKGKRQKAKGKNQKSKAKSSVSNSQFPTFEEIDQILGTAAEQANQLGDDRTEAYAFGVRGKLYEQNQQWQQAESFTKQALNLAPNYKAPDITYQFFWQLGRIRKAQGDNEGAIANYSQAVDTLQSLRSDLVTISSDVQFSFRESVEPVYRELVGLLLQPSQTSSQEVTEQGEVNPKNLVQARKVIESLQLAELDNFFRDACITAKPAQIDQIDQTAAVFYPIILSDRLEVILALPGQPLRHYTTFLPKSDIEQTLKNMRNAVTIARYRISLKRFTEPSHAFRQSSGAYSAVKEKGVGQGGRIEITARTLSLTNGGVLITSTLGQGDAGDVMINADTIYIDGEGTDSDFLFSGAYSRVEPGAEGQGGRINIAAGLLSLTNGAVVTTSTLGQGDAGSITITQADTVFLDGQSQGGSPSSLLANTGGSGDAGELTINTRQLIVQNGAGVWARTTDDGNAGTLLVSATESVTVDGEGSALNFDTSSAGNAGDLIIDTPQLVVRNGGQVSAQTSGTGDAGTLAVNADSVEVSGTSSGLYFSSSSSGDAKGIRLDTGQLVVQDEGQVTVSGTGTGNPGNLEVAAESIFLSNQGRLTGTTTSGEGGNIQLQVQDLILLRHQSLISASAAGFGNGGNIEFEAPSGLIVAVVSENSDIIASAVQGNGGSARATAAGVIGFRQFRDRSTPESDFTASSELGIDGTTQINTQNNELEELPEEMADAKIVHSCQVSRGQEQSQFVVTGRGGFPEHPKGILAPDAVVVEWATLDTQEQATMGTLPPSHQHPSTPRRQLVEAQGWIIGSDGKVILTANAPTATPYTPRLTSPSCQ